MKNTLYIYGGIFENKEREFTLDDLYSLQLDKLERYTCLKASGLEEEAWLESDEEEGSDSGSDSGSDDEEGGGGRRKHRSDDDEGAGEGQEGQEYVPDEPEVDMDPGEEGFIIEELEDGQVLVMTPAERVSRCSYRMSLLITVRASGRLTAFQLLSGRAPAPGDALYRSLQGLNPEPRRHAEHAAPGGKTRCFLAPN